MTATLAGPTLTNDDLALALRAHASDLARRGESLYRVRAFRQAAMAVLMLPLPAAEVLARGGRRALEVTPGIGRSVSAAVAELLGDAGGGREGVARMPHSPREAKLK